MRNTKKDNKINSKRTLVSRVDLANKFKHWYLGKLSLPRSVFRVKAAWQTILVILVILSYVFVVAAFYTESGEFVINIDSEMANEGFYISDTEDFASKLVTLTGGAVIDANNISIYDISNDVDKVDGEHNGNNYVAYTFYVNNSTGETKDYRYSLEIRNSQKSAEKAMWAMVFVNGKQTIYAMNGANGEPETQYSISKLPFEADSGKGYHLYNSFTVYLW